MIDERDRVDSGSLTAEPIVSAIRNPLERVSYIALRLSPEHETRFNGGSHPRQYRVQRIYETSSSLRAWLPIWVWFLYPTFLDLRCASAPSAWRRQDDSLLRASPSSRPFHSTIPPKASDHKCRPDPCMSWFSWMPSLH